MDLPILLAGLTSAVVGLAVGAPVARFAARRTAAQPVALELGAEAELLGYVLAEPGAYAKVATLGPRDFALPAHQRIWQALQDECGMPEAGQETLPAGATLPARAALDATFEGTLSKADLALARALSANGPVGDDAALLAAGGKVLDAGTDRNERGGAAPLSPGDERVPLVRRVTEPTLRRQFFTRLLLGAGAGLSWYLAPFSGTARVLSGLALVVLSVLSIVVSLVDIDTMYLDFPTFWAGSALAWALAAGADLSAHEPRRLLAGVLVSFGIGAFFEGADFCYRKIRGSSGMGFGDTLLLFATIGVPAALVGSVPLGVDAVFAGLVAGIVGALVHAAVSRRHGESFGRKSPFAFGPYLAAGWFLALLVNAAHSGGII